MDTLNLVVAYAHGRVIGSVGAMPWNYPKDLAHFQATTMGHALVMGRVTFESIGRALDGRTTIVLTTDPQWRADGVIMSHELAAAIAAARDHDPAPFICGGESIYRRALPLVTRMYLTEIDADHAGDRHFPAFDCADWREIESHAEGVLHWRTLERIAPER